MTVNDCGRCWPDGGTSHPHIATTQILHELSSCADLHFYGSFRLPRNMQTASFNLPVSQHCSRISTLFSRCLGGPPNGIRADGYTSTECQQLLWRSLDIDWMSVGAFSVATRRGGLIARLGIHKSMLLGDNNNAIWCKYETYYRTEQAWIILLRINTLYVGFIWVFIEAKFNLHDDIVCTT